MKLSILSIAVILFLQGCVRAQPLSCKPFNKTYSREQCIKDRKTLDSLTHVWWGQEQGGS